MQYVVRDHLNKPVHVIEAATKLDAEMYALRRGYGNNTQPLKAGETYASLPVERAPACVSDPRFAGSVQQLVNERRASSGSTVVQLRESGELTTARRSALDSEFEESLREAGFLSPAAPKTTESAGKTTLTEAESRAALDAEYEESLRESGFIPAA